MQLPDETASAVLADRFHRFELAIDKRFAQLEDAQKTRFDALAALIAAQTNVSREVWALDRDSQDRTTARAHKRLDDLDNWRLRVLMGILGFIILSGVNLALVLVRTP